MIFKPILHVTYIGLIRRLYRERRFLFTCYVPSISNSRRQRSGEEGRYGISLRPVFTSSFSYQL